MDNTIVDFPRKGLREGNKVAKLSTAKRDKLIFKYKTTLSEYRRNISNDNAAMVTKPVLDNNTTMLNNISVVDFTNSKVSGSRKLKVSSVVTDKSEMYYKKNHVVVKKEEIQKPIEESVLNNNVAFNDTRMSRLERTGELNNINLKEEPINNVINTPDRFMEKEKVNPYESLINDKVEESPLTRESIHNEEKNTEQNMGGDPNLYTKLVHGKDEKFGSDEVSVKLQEAISKLGIANEEKEKARAVNASLEAEVANVRETLERLRKEKEMQEQKVLENTLSMLKNAKEEILDETRKYDNLQEELASLIKERDALLKSPFVNGEDEYSTRKVV